MQKVAARKVRNMISRPKRENPPSPGTPGERPGVRAVDIFQPLTPDPSPTEYRGEGSILLLITLNLIVLRHHELGDFAPLQDPLGLLPGNEGTANRLRSGAFAVAYDGDHAGRQIGQ